MLLDALRGFREPLAQQELQRHKGQDGEDVEKPRGANQRRQVEGHDAQDGCGDHELPMAPVEEGQGPEKHRNSHHNIHIYIYLSRDIGVPTYIILYLHVFISYH